MISLLKNPLLCRNIVLRRTLFFTDFIGQHVQRNKAILAFEVIKTIKDSPLNQYHSGQYYPSLREKILEQIDSYKIDVSHLSDNQKIALAVKQALGKYFLDGVWVPTDMCNQSRFRDQTQFYKDLRQINEDVEIYVDQENSNDDLKFRKLKFCPTYFVTGQIFRKIYKINEVQFLTGQYGVGKTYSFILYNVLSQIIFRYRHKYFPNQNMSDLNSGMFKQIPKVFYWCVNKMQQYHDSNILKNILNRQFYQLKGINQFDGDIMSMSKKSSFSITYMLFNRFGIYTVLLIDQISQLASILRQKINNNLEVLKIMKKIIENQSNKYTVKQQLKAKQQMIDFAFPPDIFIDPIKNSHILANVILPQTQIDQQLKEKTQNVNEQLLKYTKYKRILHKMMSKKHFEKIIYLSSVDIQRHLLNQIELLGKTKQSYIDQRIHRIQYPISFHGDCLISDTAQFITFHLKNKWIEILSRNITSQENQLSDSIKKEIIKQLKDRKFSFFLPLKIYSAIRDSDIFSYEQFNVSASNGNLHQKVNELINQVQNQSVAQMKSKLNEFMQKTLPTVDLQNMKHIQLYQLWEESKNIIERFLQQKIQTGHAEKVNMIHKLPKFQIKFTSQNPEKNLQVTMPQILFGFRQRSKKLQCFVNPIVLHQVICSQRRKFYSGITAIQQEGLRHTLRSGTSKGNSFESALIDFLINGISTFNINLPIKPEQKLIMFQIRPFIGGFIPIPYSNSKKLLCFYFLKSFAKTIEAIFEKNMYIDGKPNNLLLMPLKKEWHQKQEQILLKKIRFDGLEKYFTCTSKWIDFVICSITDKDRTVDVNIFDTTINDHKKIVQKIQGFYQQLTNFNDKYDSIQINGRSFQFKLNYIVLTKETGSKINCKKLIQKKINQFKEDRDKKFTKDQKEQTQKMIKNMDDFILEDYENSCKVITNQKYQSGKQVMHTISVIDITKDVVLKCENELKVQLEMKLLKMIQPNLHIVVGKLQI